MTAEESAYHELCAYTLSRGDAGFMHQHVVDAFAAQHLTEDSKPIGVAFSLLGLYLHVEKNVSGKDVQRVHMLLARKKPQFPSITLPAKRGAVTAIDVMRAPAGEERDRMIDAWCESVWAAYGDAREAIIRFLAASGIQT